MLNKFLGVLTGLIGLTGLIVSVVMLLDHGQWFSDREIAVVVVCSVFGSVLILFIYRIWPISGNAEEPKIKKEIRLLELEIKRKKLKAELESDG